MSIVPSRPYQQCKRCVMDTGDPDIQFNEHGTCNHCTEFLERRVGLSYQVTKSDEALEGLVKEMKAKGKGKKYDCVLGLSGGVDSSYAAYIARQNGLRVLAVHLDNGWNSDDAVLNIRNIASKLGIDYESYVVDWEEFKDLQIAFLKASVPEAETPTDIAIPAALHRVAARYGIKYIISGGNYATEGILPVLWHYNARDTRYLRHIHKRFGSIKLWTFPLFGFLHEMYFKLVKGIKTVYLLNHVAYAKDQAMEVLKKELDWRYYGGKHYESHYTGFIQGYYLYKKFGIDYRRATFSTMICFGQLSREEALKQLNELPYKEEKVKKEKPYVAKKLGMTEAELNKIIEAPPKWYRDYPNQEKMLGFIYDTYRKLYGKKKGYNF